MYKQKKPSGSQSQGFFYGHLIFWK